MNPAASPSPSTASAGGAKIDALYFAFFSFGGSGGRRPALYSA